MVNHAVSPTAKELRQKRLQLIVHWLTVFVIFTKGLSKMEHGTGYAAALFLAALLIALGAIYHHRLEHRFPHFDVFFFLVEAAVLFMVGWLYQHDGTRLLHWVLYVSAMLYIVATIIFIARGRGRSTRNGTL